MGTRSAESEIKLSFSSQIKNTLTDGEIAQLTHSMTVLSGKLRDGVSEGQANRGWADERELTSGATETLDIYSFAALDIGAGTAADGLGQSLVMEEIVTIVIVADADNAGQLEIEPGASDGLAWIGTHTVANGGALGAGGVLLKHNPAETAFNNSSTIKNIKLTANGGACTYTILLLGRHDDDESSSSSSSSTSSLSSSSTSSLSSTSSVSSQSTSSTSSVSSTSSLSSSTSSLSSSSTSSLSSSSSESSSSSST